MNQGVTDGMCQNWKAAKLTIGVLEKGKSGLKGEVATLNGEIT